MYAMIFVFRRRAMTLFLSLLCFVWLTTSLLITTSFQPLVVTHRRRSHAYYNDYSSFPSTIICFATRVDRCDVAIVGGGFGGLYTALAIDRMSKEQKLLGKRLPNKSSLDIALIDPSDQFVFLPLLYDLTMGTASTREVCPTYAELLEGTNIRHIKASLDGFPTTTPTGSSSCSSFQLFGDNDDTILLSFDKAAVLSVGATPQSILEQVPGAAKYAQPFYTQQDAMETRDVLFRLEQQVRRGKQPKVAVVGGGYGGVELAACLARKLQPNAQVSLLTRGPPMKGTRAESLVNQALSTLNVDIELCSVDKIEPVEDNNRGASKYNQGPFQIHRTDMNGNKMDTTQEEWDVVFWTAGSAAADPVPNGLPQLSATSSGRLAVDDTLQCTWNVTNLPSEVLASTLPPIFALGDCADILPVPQPNVPKTAQAAIQQAEVCASNVLATIQQKNQRPLKSFQFQDLGTVLSLGGPNGAVLGPQDSDRQLGPLLIPLLDTARAGLSVADNVFSQILNAPTTDPKSKQVVEKLGLSLGGYGLGVEESSSGTLSGTLSGISRRAIYSLRMPTNRQRAYAAASSFVSSVTALAKEASDQYQRVSEIDQEDAK